MDLDTALRSLDASDQIIRDALEAVVTEVRAQGTRLEAVTQQLSVDRTASDQKFQQLISSFGGAMTDLKNELKKELIDVKVAATAAAATIPIPLSPGVGGSAGVGASSSSSSSGAAAAAAPGVIPSFPGGHPTVPMIGGRSILESKVLQPPKQYVGQDSKSFRSWSKLFVSYMMHVIPDGKRFLVTIADRKAEIDAAYIMDLEVKFPGSTCFSSVLFDVVAIDA